jgi:hypothetical protein
MDEDEEDLEDEDYVEDADDYVPGIHDDEEMEDDED